MGISKFVLFHGYLSSVSLRLQMDYPNTWLSWFTRQLDLELVFPSIISLRTANWNKWTKLFIDLLTLSIGSTYSLVLFIQSGGFIRFGGFFLLALFIDFIYSLALFIWSGHWIYILALFNDFIYSLVLSIRFGGSIYLPYLWALVSAYTVFFLIANSVSFSHVSERNTLTLLSIFKSHVLMVKIACLTLRHYPCLIKLTLLQVHYHTLLIRLTNIASLHHTPYTCSLIKLTNITSLHHNCYTCSIPTLHYSNIILHCSGSTLLLIPSDIKLLHLSFIFIPFVQRPASFSISKYIWNTSKLLLLSGDVEINPGPWPIDQNPVFCTICSRKINRGPQQNVAPICSNENCSARCHQACNRLSIGQTRHAKDSGRSTIWKCPQHGSEITEIIVPLTPAYEQPNWSSAVGKSCSVCRKPIHTRFADLAYHCANPACGNVCHLAAMCSGFVYLRGNARQRALSTRI